MSWISALMKTNPTNKELKILAKQIGASDAPTGWGEPEGASESVTASPDRPALE
jgi:hypothetical protein